MLELLPEEDEIFNLGLPVEIPACLGGENFCFHVSVWFVTGVQPDLPPNPTYASHIQQYLQKNSEALGLAAPLFEVTQMADVKPVECLCELTEGRYIVQLLDIKEGGKLGHWIALTEKGVFEPGVSRSDIRVEDWVRVFRTRYGVRRIFPIGLQT